MSPFTGRPLARGEFPCGWPHYIACFCGFSIADDLQWVGGWIQDPAEAEVLIKRIGLPPMDELRQLGWVPRHLR